MIKTIGYALIGYALIFGGFAFGLYGGLWWAFIGGIVQVIEAIRAEELSSLSVACGVARILFAGVIGWVCFLILSVPGMVIVRANERERR